MSTKQDPPEVAEFHKELYSLFDSRTASASKIDRLTKLAFKSAKVQYHTPTTQPFSTVYGGDFTLSFLWTRAFVSFV